MMYFFTVRGCIMGFAKDHSAEKTAGALVMNDTCMVSG